MAKDRDIKDGAPPRNSRRNGKRIAAKRILAGPFDLQTKYETRLLNNLKTLRKEYAELQKRDLGGKTILRKKHGPILTEIVQTRS